MTWPWFHAAVARILQVCNTTFYLNRFLRPLVLELSARGHEVECLCEGDDVHPEISRAGITTHAFTFPREGSPVAFLWAVSRLTKFLRNRNYDVVNSHNRNASIIARVAAWRARVPRNIYTAHGFYFHDDQRPLGYHATVALESALARITDYTLSQSQEDIALMVGSRRIPADSISHIGNGIDLERFTGDVDRAAAERAVGLRPNRFRIAALGRLVQGKGFQDLLEAFARFRQYCPTAELLQIGGNIQQDVSPFEAQYRDRVRSLKLEDSVVMTGITDRVPEYLAAADLFVLPSYREGMPRALLEAMAMQLPVIATNVRGCREIVSHGVNGYLFPARDIGALARLLVRAQTLAPAQRHEMGQAARNLVVDRFAETAYTARQCDQLETCIGPRGPKRRARLIGLAPQARPRSPTVARFVRDRRAAPNGR